MEVIVIESETFRRMEAMYRDVCQKVLELSDENLRLKGKKWLTAQEVAKRTPYTASTILSKKNDIGFKQDGKIVIFRTEDVEAWMSRDYSPPKRAR